MIYKSFVAAGALGACLCLLSPGLRAQTQTVEAGKSLVLDTPSGRGTTADFLIQFDWMGSDATAPTLSLPNGQSIVLQDDRIGKIPGLWQSVSLHYVAPKAGRPAIMNRLIVNGVTLQEGINLLGGNANGQPVRLTTSTGAVQLRNVLIRPLNDRQVANWTGPLTYRLYRNSIDRRENLDGQTPLKTDTTSGINYNVAYGQAGRTTTLFDGKLNVPTAGEYLMDLQMGGAAGLWIDGKAVIPVVNRDLVEPESKSVNLTAGTHDVQVLYTRTWFGPGLGLFISQPDTRPQPLHLAASLPEVTPVGTMLVEPEPRPTLVRSFIQMPGERSKRTHALSVGSQTGMHYSLDLNQMALLMVWKGDFADVTQMWFERGEPQLLRSAGATIYPAPRTGLAPLAGANAVWPDSLGTDVLQYKGLILDKEGNPTADYTLAGTTVRDQLRPSANALNRTLTINGTASSPLYCRLAASKAIQSVGKGLYAIDDRSYFIRVDPKAPVSVRTSGGQQELVMPVAIKNGVATVSYSLEF